MRLANVEEPVQGFVGFAFSVLKELVPWSVNPAEVYG